MNTTKQLQISELREGLKGQVFGPGDPGYEELRRVYFSGFDRRPAAFVRARTTEDVQQVIILARHSGAELAVRSGGHSRTGDGTTEGGIVIDLSAMNAVEVARDARSAWAQTGVKAGEYTRVTGERGRATGLGDTASVGLGGITLAGGMGFLVRKHGLTIDDVLAAEVVAADGEILSVDECTHPDLFWALRGGGGNFGIVTRLRLRLHDIDGVVGGMLVLPATARVISNLVAVADAAPEDLSVIAKIMKSPPLPFIPKQLHGKPVVMARMVHAGTAAAALKDIAAIRGLATPIADMVRTIRYPQIYSEPEPPGPAFSIGTNLLLDGLSTAAAETILEHLQTLTTATPVIEVRILGGAMARVPEDATAFAHRGAKLMVNIAAVEHNPQDRSEHCAWAAGLAEALSDGVTVPAYAGFAGGDADDLSRVYPPATLKRLAQVKRRYDPENVFHLNLNITPDGQ